MVVLGLDTATAAASAAVLTDDGTAVERRHDPAPGERPGHSARLLELAEAALEAAGVGWDGVGRIAVGIGPGGFTGLRIGLATARGLAQGRGIELVGVSSLAALALPALRPGATVLGVIDARRGEAFAAAYGPSGSELQEAAARKPEALAELVAGLGTGVRAVGDGAVAFRAVLEAAGAHVAPDADAAHRLTATAVCRLGRDAAAPVGAAPLPDYRRDPDAIARRTP